MTPAEIEETYEALAEALDRAGPENHELFLAKLALLLSREVGNTDRVRTLIGEAERNIGV